MTQTILPADVQETYIDNATSAGFLALGSDDGTGLIKYRILSITVDNPSGNAITGGLKFGLTNGGTQVMSALAVPANSIVVGKDANINNRASALFVNNPKVFYDAVTSWNGASVNITVLWVPFFSTRQPV